MAYAQFSGVICLALAALLSLLSVSFYFMKPSLRGHNYGRTHINGYFRSLLLANGVQAFGTVMSFKWAADRGVTPGTFCGLQGGIKQAGNVATALWSFVLAVHLFNLLFLRLKSTKTGFWCTIVGGWAAVFLIVIIGPTAIQTPMKGPYFGISGAWCWITSNYPQEQIFLEYFFEYLSAVFCFVLYTTILLRLRGNLIKEAGKWRLYFLPRGQSWQLSLCRDLIDHSMLQAVQQMMWYPVVYTMLILPITLARGWEFRGEHVPFWITVVTDAIFNLTGFVNVLLLTTTRKAMPSATELPEFTRPRKDLSRDSLIKACGITPFTIERSETAEKWVASRPSLEVAPQAPPGLSVPPQAHVNGAQ